MCNGINLLGKTSACGLRCHWTQDFTVVISVYLEENNCTGSGPRNRRRDPRKMGCSNGSDRRLRKSLRPSFSSQRHGHCPGFQVAGKIGSSRQRTSYHVRSRNSGS
ncbi:hypothetical protein G9C98_007084 [Cotesia typhae]|uniref:Uncharacterized protein n=1 Tax=Cotesia typhae TaxID=2053667 RepID=A0A8J5QT94_9HYME|nr:hypothetical protein G9C98_007084 [Cotesia typhae]